MNKRRAKTSLQICTSHFICKVCVWEGVGDWTKTAIYWPPPHSYGRQRCVFLVLQGCSAGGPGAQLSVGWWLSLLHLIGNFSGPQLNRGPRGPLRPGVAFPTTSRLLLQLISNFLSWLSYILVQRPLNRPLNLWNGMFDRHQAEITVMQFTGHSLPVHQSMSVPWDFFLPCPISSAKSHLRDFFRLLAIGTCHFGMAYLPGSKVKIQQQPSRTRKPQQNEWGREGNKWSQIPKSKTDYYQLNETNNANKFSRAP